MWGLGIGEGVWYEKVQDRREWYEAYSERRSGAASKPGRHQEERTIECAVCRKLFRREADKARHKCSSHRAKPVDEQRGSVKCDACGRWFRSRGGLAVHRCSQEEDRVHLREWSLGHVAGASGDQGI